MKEVAIIGVGIHRFGRFETKSYLEFGQEAAQMALRDAHLEWKDVQLAYLSKMYLPATSGARILKTMGGYGNSHLRY